MRAVAFSPDGRLLASAGDDPDIKLWETATGKLAARLQGHTDWVLALAFQPDGKVLASGGFDGVIRLWDAAAGRKLLEFAAHPPNTSKIPSTEGSTVEALAYDPAGKILAAAGSDGAIRLLDVHGRRELTQIAAHKNTVYCVAFNSAGTLLASAGLMRARAVNCGDGGKVRSSRRTDLMFLSAMGRSCACRREHSRTRWPRSSGDLREQP